MLTNCAWLSDDEDKGMLLAEVGTQRLYLSDVASQVQESAPDQDSIAALRLVIDDWVKQAVLIDEALENFANDAEMDRLVEAYRHDLLRDRYEQVLTDNNLDTVVTEAQLMQLYQEAGPAFKLEQPIVRAAVYKFREPMAEQDKFESAWKQIERDTNSVIVERLAKQYANLSLQATDWRTLGAIQSTLPADAISSATVGTRVAREDGFVYYIRIFERFDSGQPAPLAYVRAQLVAAVREQRRASFLATHAEQAYRSARQKDAVKIYVNE